MTAPVVFDLDGTLIDSLPNITAAANALLADKGLAPLPAVQVAGFVGFGEKIFLERLIAATDLDSAEFDALMPPFLAHYKHVARETRLFDGVTGALETLAGQGVALGLCTNKPTGPLMRVLETVALTRFFDVVIAGDTLAQRKPHPAPLHHAFEQLGAPGLYVGDSEVDAETAQRAGIPFALFTRGIRQGPIDAIPHWIAFDDFTEFPAIYARFLKGI